MQEIYPQERDWEYTNGGCAFDVDQDGSDEIVTGRGHGRSRMQPQSIWQDEVEGSHRSRCTPSRAWTLPHGQPRMMFSR
jgi:hypothetical protein